MKINIIDNKEYDSATLYDQWITNHDWYRSIDTFQNNFPDNFKFTYWNQIDNDVYSIDLF